MKTVMVRAWDKDAGTPAGVLALREWMSGGIAVLNHRLPAGKPPASSNRDRVRGKDGSQSRGDFVLEDIHT